jgi:chemotaxis protein methyltransferase CheR
MLLQNEQDFELFVQNLTINVTEMFRDPNFYKSLRENVLKRLGTYSAIIILAGCSTGEEVYSLAIMLQEEGLLSRSVIFATDINQRVLQKAKDGVFSVSNMQSYTSNYMKAGGNASFSDYYMANHGFAILDRSLKQNIVFSVHNLVTDKSFNEFQLVLCRNVMIYFNQILQNRVFHLFKESLCPFGFLGLGNKETLHFSEVRNDFREVDQKEKIYTKIA